MTDLNGVGGGGGVGPNQGPQNTEKKGGFLSKLKAGLTKSSPKAEYKRPSFESHFKPSMANPMPVDPDKVAMLKKVLTLGAFGADPEALIQEIESSPYNFNVNKSIVKAVLRKFAADEQLRDEFIAATAMVDRESRIPDAKPDAFLGQIPEGLVPIVQVIHNVLMRYDQIPSTQNSQSNFARPPEFARVHDELSDAYSNAMKAEKAKKSTPS